MDFYNVSALKQQSAGRHVAPPIFSDSEVNYRDVQKVFGHCKFLLYISYKNHNFSKHYSKVNSYSILMIFLPTEVRTYVVFCDYFKIFFWSTDFKYSWLKHKLKLFVFKCTIIVLCFWRSKFSFVFNSWTHIYRL